MDWQTLRTLLSLDEAQWRGQLVPEARVGQILLRHGLVDDFSLGEALAYQAHAGDLLGEILVAWGRCTHDQISWALGCQFAETRLIQLLLRHGAVELPHLQQALLMLHEEPQATLPGLLVREGWISQERMEELLHAEYHQARLGQILLLLGILTEDQLAAGLTRQLQSDEPLGEALIFLGYCQASDVERALAVQGR